MQKDNSDALNYFPKDPDPLSMLFSRHYGTLLLPAFTYQNRSITETFPTPILGTQVLVPSCVSVSLLSVHSLQRYILLWHCPKNHLCPQRAPRPCGPKTLMLQGDASPQTLQGRQNQRRTCHGSGTLPPFATWPSQKSGRAFSHTL